MRTPFILLLFLTTISTLAQDDLAFDWAVSSSNNVSLSNFGRYVFVDADSNIYAVGEFAGSSDLDPGTGVSNHTANGLTDVYIQKFNSSGTLQWAKTIGSTNYDNITGITGDGQGKLFICGFVGGTTDFDPSTTSSFNLTPALWINSAFLLTLDTNGSFIDATLIDGTGRIHPYRLLLSNSGDLFIGGYFAGKMDADPAANDTVFLEAHGLNDVFILKYDTAFNYLASGQIGGTGWDHINDAFLDGDSLVICGYFANTADLDPTSTIATKTSSGGFDGYILIVDSNIRNPRIYTLGGSDDDYISSITRNNYSELLFTGAFSGTADLDPTSATSTHISNGMYDAFVACFNSNYTKKWIKTFGDTLNDAVGYVKYDIVGNPYLIGRFSGTVDFDPGPSSFIFQGVPNPDVFISKFDRFGNFRWAKRLGNSDSDYEPFVTQDVEGALYFTGNFHYIMDFDVGADTFLMGAAGGSGDSYLMKMRTCDYGVRTDTVDVCYSYTWVNGKTYNESNYTDQLVMPNAAVNGCDSILNLHLTVHGDVRTVDTVVSCDTFTWINNYTYTSSNNISRVTFYNTTKYGCDSIVRLNLSMLYKGRSTDTITTCDSFQWRDGVTYYSSTDTPYVILNGASSNGCDSIINLKLTIHNSNERTDHVSACDSFTWIDGLIYRESTSTPIFRTMTTRGCDSIVHLDLTISSTKSTTQPVISCDSFIWKGNTLIHDSIFYDTLSTRASCDSIVMIDLHIDHASYYVDQILGCDSITWIDGLTYSTDIKGVRYTLTQKNSAGCDSIAILDLTLNSTSYSIDTLRACVPFTWINGTTYLRTTTDTFRLAGSATNGCDSVIRLHLIASNPDTSVIHVHNTLLANDTSLSYSWLNCLQQFEPLSNEHDHTFTATSNGSYAMEVTNSFCSDTSGCYTIETAAITGVHYDQFTLYPNPTGGLIYLELPASWHHYSVQLYDPQGQLVYNVNSGDSTIDLTNLPPQVYVVRITSPDNGVFTARVVRLTRL